MRNLFRPPSGALVQDLESAMRAILAATPLSRVHERELQFAVRDLSRMLTQDRTQLARSYWINKRLLTAYCRYFLPWNLLRLSWLLPNLDLPMREDGVILDLGSGPLTLPIALWLAKPEWRAMPLTVVCSDVAPGPLGLGRDIFALLAGDSPWKIELHRGPLEATLRSFQKKADIISAVNVLNEYKPSREIPLEARLQAFTRLAAAKLSPQGRFLAVEPGTRLGGKLMAITRRAGFAAHLVPEVPCPQWGACPMLEDRATGWCHFSHTAEAAPESLVGLTRRAKLDKDSLSLSCLLLRPATEEEVGRATAFLPPEPEDEFFEDELDDALEDFAEDALPEGDEEGWAAAFAAISKVDGGPDFVRILSDPIRIPGLREAARYGCSPKGLVLAHNALRMPSGAVFAVRWPEGEARDPKTDALVVTVPLRTTKEREIMERDAPAGRKPFAAKPGKEGGSEGRAPRVTRAPSRSGEGRRKTSIKR